MSKFAYLPLARARSVAKMPLAPLTPRDKLRVVLEHLAGERGVVGGRLVATIPRWGQQDVHTGIAKLREALPQSAKVLDVRHEVVLDVEESKGGADLWDAAMVLASYDFVRDIRVEELPKSL